MSPESPEPETDYTLTPRTEAKYNKIDEEFQLMMHRTQMSGVAGGGGGGGTTGGGGGNGGGPSGRHITTANYSLPVSVPVAGGPSYGSGADGLLQSSPQLSHTNISPRPSSSETDSGEFRGNTFN